MAKHNIVRKAPEDDEPRLATKSTKDSSPKARSAAKSTKSGSREVLPATELMKRVAEATGDVEKMKKSFTPAEIEKILKKYQTKEAVSKKDNQALARATRENKRWVVNHAEGDYSKLYLYPSYTSNSGQVWYKMVDFSALYFVYYLSERMGMTVRLYDDKDNYVKCSYSAFVPDIESVATKFIQLGGKNVETTLSGVYIFTLAQPMTTEEYMNMVKEEKAKREKMRNILRPTAMQPLTYKRMLDVIRFFGPKIRNLERREFFSIGQKMMDGLMQLFELYYLYSDGLLEKSAAGARIISVLDKERAGLALLQEMDAWKHLSTPVMLGEALMNLRNQVLKDFNIKISTMKETTC